MRKRQAEIESLSPQAKRALLAQLIRQKAGTAALKVAAPARDLPTITPAPDERHAPFPLTALQQAYWVGRGTAFDLGNVSIHYYMEVDSVDLDLQRFNRAWQRVVERHDMLRAIVLPSAEQRILPEVPPYEIPVVDLRALSAEEQASRLEEIRRELSHQVLPADRWPLFELRAALLRDGGVRVHFSIDLLCLDGASLHIINNDWVQFYLNPDAELPPLELSFRDYVLAEQSLRKSETRALSLEYWRGRAGSLPPGPDLPLARAAESLPRAGFVRRHASLDPSAWQRFKDQASHRGLTPSSLLLAAYAEVLRTWSKNPRFTINVTLFNRLPLHPQVNEIVGDFTSMVLLEAPAVAEDTVHTRARRLQEQLWRDLEYREVSGIDVLREVARSRGSATELVTPVVFTSMVALGGQGLRRMSQLSRLGEIVYAITQTPQVWLDYQVREEFGSLLITWDAVEELFPPGVLDDMFEAHRTLLGRFMNDDAVWSEKTARWLPVRQRELRTAVNRTDAPLSDRLLHAPFIERAVEAPQRLAVVAGARSLDYEEVRCRVHHLAGRLRQLGTPPNTLVAVVMERGWEQVVAVLAILEAGAAYLPIDANLPPERLEYLLANGQVRVVLTQTWISQRPAWPEGVERICVDREPSAAPDEPSFPALQGPEDLAYVIYTSGSTGQPKGVMIDHRGAVNTVLDVNRRFAIQPDDRILAISSLSFDLSVYDVFGMLAAGAALVVPDASALRDPEQWARLMVEQRVTVWNSVPALMSMLVEYLERHPDAVPKTLRLVLLSGDWIPLSLPDRIKRLFEGVEVVSLGGATEASVWSILRPIDGIDPSWKSIPYGRPMVNQSFHVLDENLQPCPTWVPGQLYIGGVGVAKGYWRDPEKTRAKFIADPKTGERLYATGDVGRYLPDAEIELLGREDLQVKIQGHRIELGEIEAALAQHEGVREAVAVAVGDPRGDKRLVAYVVPRHPATEAAGGGETAESPSAEDFGLPAIPELALDPAKSLEFKMSRPGLRAFHDDRSVVALLKPAVDEDLARVYAARRSWRTFDPEPVSFEQLSRFLSCLQPLDREGSPLPKYRYPSAGSLYPVQAYLHVKPGRVHGLAAGVYYYHPESHQLELLAPDPPIGRGIHVPTNRAIFDQAAFAVFLIAQLRAIEPMYGDLAADFCKLEAGYMGQLLMTSAPDEGLGLCPIGALNFQGIRQHFDLTETHLLVHSFLGGRAPASDGRDAGADPHAGRSSPLVDDLRRFLGNKLPAYMVPSAFVVLDALPLTSNDKLDRKALADPDFSLQSVSTAYVAPSTDVERMLAALVREILKVDRVGIHDNLFELGANSVHLVQVQSRMEATLSRKISVVDMFRYPTIASMATHLSRDEAGSSGEPSPIVKESESRAESRKAALARRRQGEETTPSPRDGLAK